MTALLIGIVLAVAFVCWQAGELYDLRQELRVLRDGKGER